jgi:hypothetical protein
MYVNKAAKKTGKVSVWCTATEKRYIDSIAKKAGVSASEYLRELGLKEMAGRPKTLPPEVLAYNGHLAQLAGSLSVISRKRLNGEELNALERAGLQHLARDIGSLIQDIKNYLS